MKLSVVIPAYNAGQYLATCLDTVLEQGLTAQEQEVIVVDDGSTDRTREVVSRYPMVRYVYQRNQGQSAARNHGLELARGEYVWFVDADDMVVPRSIAPVLEAGFANDLDVVAFNMRNTPAESLAGSAVSGGGKNK